MKIQKLFLRRKNCFFLCSIYIIVVHTFGIHLPKESLGCEYIGVLKYVFVNNKINSYKKKKF